MMLRPFSVAVFCSSSDHIDPSYHDLAEALGRALAARGWRLVYGAGSVGLMGTLARATHAGGGQVYGVIPHALDRREVVYEACDELLRVETMRQRKALMEENADAFIALPGGFGTLEEIIEIIVLKQLEYIDRPVVFLNVNDYWTELLDFFERMIDKQFVRPVHRHLFKLTDSVGDALDYVANYYPEVADGRGLGGTALRVALE